MTIAVVYVFPEANRRKYVPLARRFVDSYMEHPSGTCDHDLYVLVTGGMNGRDYSDLFHPLPCGFLIHDNSGQDIGAYQMAAETIPCDLLVCLGSPVHFHKPGWLDLIERYYCRMGPGMYGPWGFHEPSVHLRTTAFWLPPDLLRSYPVKVGNGGRYAFEHSKTKSMTAHTLAIGLNCYMVTWKGCYEPTEWHTASNDETLFLDQHTDQMSYA